jgi:hypothetical protein
MVGASSRISHAAAATREAAHVATASASSVAVLTVTEHCCRQHKNSKMCNA